jgi:hypothetical protein
MELSKFDESIIKYLEYKLLAKDEFDPKKKIGLYIEAFVAPLVSGKPPLLSELVYAGVFYN